MGGGAEDRGAGQGVILLDKSTRVIVQGITGREGSFHAEQMRAMGTALVGGVSPGKGGTTHLDVPIFDTVANAVRETGANATGIFVPAPFAADAIMEAASAGIRLIVAITEGIPIQDMIRVKEFLRAFPQARLIGPNCPGLITPGIGKIGIIPQRICTPGGVGLVSRSGTLTYEVVAGLTAAGMGQSTCVGIGGDPILGLSFSDVIALFEQDEATRDLVVIGEIGGSDEERAAELLGRGTRLNVVAFISGRTAPEGKRMGHAGAIVSGNRGTARSKEDAFRAAGVKVAETTDEIIELLRETARSGAVLTER
jgi:succinyl-CoA synthetase alpha subunit